MRLVLEIGEAALSVQRHGIVDLRADALGGQVSAQLVALARANHVLVEDVPEARHSRRHLHGWPKVSRAEQLVVMIRVGLPRARPGVEMLQLDHEHRRLQLVEPKVAADQRVVVLRLAAVHAQDAHALVQPAVVADAHAGVAECAEILRREERQAADVADAAGPPAVRQRGADRLRGILDDGEPILAR